MRKVPFGRALAIALLTLAMSVGPTAASSSPVVYFHSGPGSMTLTAGSWWITATGNSSNPGFETTCALNDLTNVAVLDAASWDFRTSGQGGSIASYFLTATYSVS